LATDAAATKAAPYADREPPCGGKPNGLPVSHYAVIFFVGLALVVVSVLNPSRPRLPK
jgi:hypothetical protein